MARIDEPRIVSPHFSVVIPAHNEHLLLPRALAAIDRAADQVAGSVEVLVVANRCTDATADIASAAGAIVVTDDSRNIAAVRNVGAAAARGDVLLTIDADSMMAPNTFREVDRLLATGRYVGGGTKVVPERRSAGILATYALVEVLLRVTRRGGGMFWCHRADFEAIGGFDESFPLAEDLEFAGRLSAHGKRTGRRFTNMRAAPMVASCRKFDRFGDWHMFGFALQIRQIRAAMRGTDARWVDRYFFDFNH